MQGYYHQLITVPASSAEDVSSALALITGLTPGISIPRNGSNSEQGLHFSSQETLELIKKFPGVYFSPDFAVKELPDDKYQIQTRPGIKHERVRQISEEVKRHQIQQAFLD